MRGIETSQPSVPVSPLMLADRLLSLAQDADRSGDRETASRLMFEMMSMLDRRGVQ